MPIQYPDMPQFQAPNLNLMGAYAQGAALQQQQLQDERLRQQMAIAEQSAAIAAERDARQADLARVQMHGAQFDNLAKVRDQFREDMMNVNNQAQADKIFERYGKIAGDILPQDRTYSDENKRRWMMGTDKFVEATKPYEREYVNDKGQLVKGRFYTNPITNQEIPVGGAELPQAKKLVEVKDAKGNILGVRGETETSVTPLTFGAPAVAPTAAAPTGEGVPGPRGAATAMQILPKFEGFIPKAKFDVNAQRVGYGSDTVTTPEGKVVPVNENTTITQQDAQRDLQRRVQSEFIPKAAAQVGQENWDRLPENVAGALTSVTYNYGSLPNKVAAAVKTGNVNAIANAVEALADDNKGINRGRRMSEAAMIRGSEMPGSAAVPSFAAAPPPAALGMSPQIQPPINMMAGGAMPIQNAMAAPTTAPAATPMTVAEFAQLPLKRKNTEFFKDLLTSYEDQQNAGILPTKTEGGFTRGKKITMANLPPAVARTVDPAGQELRDITSNKIDQYITMLRETGTMTGGEGNTIAELEAKKKMLAKSDMTIDAIRKIVVDLDKRFGTGTLKAEGGATTKNVTVDVPGMGSVSFPSQEAADAFRREAGL